MADFDVESVLRTHLGTLDDDILQYLISVVEGMSLDERKSNVSLNETVGPFLVDSGFSASEQDAEDTCKTIAISFGGSGMKTVPIADSDGVSMLAAPVKMIERSGLDKNQKNTYGGSTLTSFDDDGTLKEVNHNSELDASSIPTTQKQLRKNRKETERLQKILRAEELARLKAEEEMAAARMAAIKANRTAGRQASMGVNIERFSIPHPSGTSDLLTDASLVLASGRRYGLVGKNGAGKSTLMKMLATYKINGLQHLRILLVDQHVEGDAQSPLQWVLRADVERTALINEEEQLLEIQRGDMPAHKIPKSLQGVNIEVALQEIYERMDAIGANTAEIRARKILNGLGFTERMMEKPTVSLSGGWAMRAALAAALFMSPDLLLLDEPTNHLDLHALVWLEHWLTEVFLGTLLVVSHDQVFLDSVCTDILELKTKIVGSSKSTLTHYSGDYSTYRNTLKDHRIAQQRLRLAYEKERDKLKEFISREGRKFDNPAHQSQRKMKMKQLEQLEEVEIVEDESELVMKFPKPYGIFEKTENLIAVQDVSFRWDTEDDQPGDILFDKVDFTIGAKARIALLGKNGCGKTSLLNVLVGEAPPTTGNVKRHLGCRIARLQQHHYKGEQLDPNLTPLEHMRRMPQDETTGVGFFEPDTRQEESAQRAFLSNFGINGTRAVLPVRYLSGGQRMRVALAVVLYRRPDLIILDEPTNHLDAETVRSLCKALSQYEGAILAVSHDETFVNNVIAGFKDEDDEESGDKESVKGELWVMSKKRLSRFDGTFSQYKKLISSKVHLS